MLTTVGDDQWPIRRTLLKRLKQRFDVEGIEIPYQYLNVIQVPSETAPVASVASSESDSDSASSESESGSESAN